MLTICAVIPLFNEEHQVKDTIEAVKRIQDITCIVAVDDGSSDSTYEIISQIEGIKVLRHKKNMGKAAAIKDGVKLYPADIYAFIDGDTGKSAYNIIPIIKSVENNECDMCIANIPETPGTGGMGILRSFSRFAVKYTAGVDFPCPLCGMRAVKGLLLYDRRIKFYRRYGIEVGMLMDALKSGYRVKYMDIYMKHITTGKNMRGYIHRFSEFIDVLFAFLCNVLRW